MDIEMIARGISTFGTAIGILKQITSLLPDGMKKNEASENLVRAEREMKIAESQIAAGMEYELCRKHFPPEIMLTSDGVNWECQVCGNKTFIGLTMGVIRHDFAQH